MIESFVIDGSSPIATGLGCHCTNPPTLEMFDDMRCCWLHLTVRCPNGHGYAHTAVTHRDLYLAEQERGGMALQTEVVFALIHALSADC
jgi:hypothetical protein